MLQVIPEPFGVFPIFNNLVSQKMAGLRAKYKLNLCVIQFDVVIVCDLDKHSVKAPGLLVTVCFFFTGITIEWQCLSTDVHETLKSIACVSVSVLT